MKKRSVHLLMALCMTVSLLSTAALATETNSTRAASDINIVFSNIAEGGTASSPPTSNTKTVIGKAINPGYTMIKLADLKYMGATVQQIGTKYYVTINNQTIIFIQGSTSYSSSTPYIIKKPAGGSQSYTFSVRGTTEAGLLIRA